MFIGHFGLAFAAKPAAPQVSLGTLFIAAQFADLLWPVLVLLGVESLAIDPGATAVTPLDFVHYPYSHSLLALVIWGLLFGAAYKAVQHARPPVVFVLAALIVSHWILDFLTHRPDMPLAFSGDVKVGMGLWNSLAGTLIVELLLLAAGVALYLRSTVPKDRIGSIGLAALIAFLVVIELANLFGPPPPTTAAVVWPANAMWLLVAWGYWVDRHRASVAPVTPNR